MDSHAQTAQRFRIAVSSISLTVTVGIFGKLPLCRGVSMPSENYRYYCLDGAGHLHGAEWFYAESDADAIAQISAKHPDGKSEIWQGRRLVASISPERRQA